MDKNEKLFHNGHSPNETEETPGWAYFTGALGALLGALVSAAIISLVGLAGVFSAFLGFLTGILSVKGYMILRGPRKYRFAAAVVMISSVLTSAGSAIWLLIHHYAVKDSYIVAVWTGALVAFSVWGFIRSNRVLQIYINPQLLEKHLETAKEIIMADTAKQTDWYYAEHRWIRPLHISISIAALVPILLMAGLTVYGVSGMEGRYEGLTVMILSSAIGIICGFFTIVIGLIPALRLMRADQWCYMRTENGELWRIHLPRLNQNETYRFSVSNGALRAIHGRFLKTEENEMAKASMIRAVEDIQCGRIFPGNSIHSAVAPMTDLQLKKENRWKWVVRCKGANGQERKIVIPKAYPRFSPVPDSSAPQGPVPYRFSLMICALAVSLILGVGGAYIGFVPYATNDFYGGSTETTETTDTTDITDTRSYTVDGITFEVSRAWSEIEGHSGAFTNKRGTQIYAFNAATPLGSSRWDEAYRALLDYYEQDHTLLEVPELLSPYSLDGGVDCYANPVYMLDNRSNVYNFIEIVVVPQKNLMLTFVAYQSEKFTLYEQDDAQKALNLMWHSLTFEIGSRDDISGNMFLNEDGSELSLQEDGSFRYYRSEEDHQNQYYEGTYEVFYGQDALDKVASMTEYGLTMEELERILSLNMNGYVPGDSSLEDLFYTLEPDMNDKRTRYQVCKDTFYAVILHNDKLVVSPEEETVKDHDTLYIGFYIPELEIADMTNANAATHVTWTYKGKTNP